MQLSEKSNGKQFYFKSQNILKSLQKVVFNSKVFFKNVVKKNAFEKKWRMANFTIIFIKPLGYNQ